MEDRNGIAVNGCVTQATGRAEPQAAMAMVAAIPGWHRLTLGAHKGYDSSTRALMIKYFLDSARRCDSLQNPGEFRGLAI